MHNQRSNKYQSWLVIFIAVAATFLPLIAIEYKLLQYTGNVFMYPLDDTFIHIELAKNLAQHQTWGINPGEFGSASSSLLYSVLLAISFKIFSGYIIIPFIINSIAAVLLIVAVQKWMNKNGIEFFAQLIILLAIVFFVPLPILIMSGMEHTLQCLFAFLFLFGFADWVERSGSNGRWKLPWSLFIYGMLLSSIRYEGIFLVGIACLVLFYYKKYGQGFLLGLVSLLPVIVFGIFAVSKGGFFIPNSVLVKSGGAALSLSGLPGFISGMLIDKLTTSKTITALATQRLLIILPVAYFLFRKTAAYSSKLLVILIMLGALLHLAFATTGWFYRYEAYLVLCSILILSLLIYQHGKQVFADYKLPAKAFSLIAVFFLFFPFVLRSMAAFTKAKQACVNIYDQQYQMGQFLKQYYPDQIFAANDIGAVSYYTNGRVIDLWGLATTEVAKSRKKNYWNADFLDKFSRERNTKLAVVYDSWFDSSLLKRWTKVGEWKIQNNVIGGDDKVSFYAIDTSYAQGLKINLQSYQPKLPSTVEVKYY